VKALSPHDTISVPTILATCPACTSGLFALVRSYFADTGEPIENSIFVGCVNCDAEIGSPVLNDVRQWVHSNYRVESSPG
jgi:hypothetical protein